MIDINELMQKAHNVKPRTPGPFWIVFTSDFTHHDIHESNTTPTKQEIVDASIDQDGNHFFHEEDELVVSPSGYDLHEANHFLVTLIDLYIRAHGHGPHDTRVTVKDGKITIVPIQAN